MQRRVMLAVLVVVGGACCRTRWTGPLPTGSAKEERASMRQRLEASGPNAEGWASAAAETFAAWNAAAERAGGARFSPATCYRDGCIAAATYRDTSDVGALDRALLESDAFHAWRGAKFRSPLVTGENGSLEADWILFRPEGP